MLGNDEASIALRTQPIDGLHFIEDNRQDVGMLVALFLLDMPVEHLKIVPRVRRELLHAVLVASTFLQEHGSAFTLVVVNH
jgi:hypothetical protein